MKKNRGKGIYTAKRNRKFQKKGGGGPNDRGKAQNRKSYYEWEGKEVPSGKKKKDYLPAGKGFYCLQQKKSCCS